MQVYFCICRESENGNFHAEGEPTVSFGVSDLEVTQIIDIWLNFRFETPFETTQYDTSHVLQHKEFVYM